MMSSLATPMPASGEPLVVQHQPTFPFVGIGWRYEQPAFPPAAEVIARPAPERPVYGLYCWASEYVEFNEQIHDIGWTNFRVSGPMTDEGMAAYARDGVDVMATLSPRLYGTFRPEAPMSIWVNRADFETDEAFIDYYVTGTRRWLERYGPGGLFFAEHPDLPYRPIKAIEVYNEPNFWYLDTSREEHRKGRGPLTEDERLAIEARREALYARLLAETAEAIRKGWPEVKIVGFAAGGSANADVRFIKNVHAASPATAGSYDVLSTHPYLPRPVAPEGVALRTWGQYSIWRGLSDIRGIMESYGTADRPIWYTELGWAINPRSGGAFEAAIRPADDGLANVMVDVKGIPADIDPRKWVDPLTHAAYITRMYAMTVRMGVDRLFFMSIVDTDGFNSGFLNKDGTYRPTAFAVRNMIDLMPNPKLAGVVSDGEQGVFAYRFQRDANNPALGEAVMAWSIELQGRSLTLDTAVFGEGADRLTAVTMLGDQKEIPLTEDGFATIALGPCPVYFIPASN